MAGIAVSRSAVRALIALTVAAGFAGAATFMALPVDASPDAVTAADTPVPPVTAGAAQQIVPIEVPRLANGSAPMWASEPTHLFIGAIGVDTALMGLGVQADGSMEVPPGAYPAGWYTGAPTPGELGTALLAGHVDWLGPAVFHDLDELQPGDLVTVTRADSSTATFAVSHVEMHAKTALPKDLLFGQSDNARLVLVTCGGVIDPATGHYVDNTFVFADLVDSTSPLG